PQPARRRVAIVVRRVAVRAAPNGSSGGHRFRAAAQDVTKLKLDERARGADESEDMICRAYVRFAADRPLARAGGGAVLAANAGKPHGHFFLFRPLSCCNRRGYAEQLR